MYLTHARESPPDVRDSDRAADDQCDIECVNDFFTLPAFLPAANEMIRDAIVAAENGGRDEAHKFLRFRAEGAWLVGLMIESEEALHAEVAAIQDFLVQVGARFLKIVETVCHDSSESGAAIMRQIGLSARDANWFLLWCKTELAIARWLVRDCRESFSHKFSCAGLAGQNQICPFRSHLR